MGKITSLINTTVDGFVDSHYVIADAEFHEYVHGLLKDTEVVAFGKNTFEIFQNVWPAVLEKDDQPASQTKMARALHEIDKIVFSDTIKHTTWHNTRIETLNAKKINDFRHADRKNLLTIGSPGIVAALTKLNLVDDYYFPVQPTIAGNGQSRLFDQIKLESKQPLKFISATPLNSGVVIIHYKVLRDITNTRQVF
jgi:dihydrofolate reductase